MHFAHRFDEITAVAEKIYKLYGWHDTVISCIAGQYKEIFHMPENDKKKWKDALINKYSSFLSNPDKADFMKMLDLCDKFYATRSA